MVRQEEQYYDQLAETADAPEEVVNIHFAQKNFENYQILMMIEK